MQEHRFPEPRHLSERDQPFAVLQDFAKPNSGTRVSGCILGALLISSGLPWAEAPICEVHFRLGDCRAPEISNSQRPVDNAHNSSTSIEVAKNLLPAVWYGRRLKTGLRDYILATAPVPEPTICVPSWNCCGSRRLRPASETSLRVYARKPPLDPPAGRLEQAHRSSLSLE
jgi:hypothetical protein